MSANHEEEVLKTLEEGLDLTGFGRSVLISLVTDLRKRVKELEQENARLQARLQRDEVDDHETAPLSGSKTSDEPV